MADNSRKVSELDQQPVLADQDRLLICLANGAVRTANVTTALANADVTIGKLILANANSTSTPANSSIAVAQGAIWTDGTYIYVSMAPNQIKRALLSSF